MLLDRYGFHRIDATYSISPAYYREKSKLIRRHCIYVS